MSRFVVALCALSAVLVAVGFAFDFALCGAHHVGAAVELLF